VRIAVLDTVYPEFANEFYARRPGLAQRSYDEQLRALLDFSFGTSDAYTEGLRALGHESWNLLTNVLPLQTAWLRREGLRGLLRRSESLGGRPGRGARHLLLQAIVSAQIAQLNPEVVFVHDAWSIESPLLRKWRRDGRFLVTQIGSAPPAIKRVRQFDLVLSSFRHFVERFRSEGVDSEYFMLAFHEKVLDRLRAIDVDPAPDSDRPVRVAFVGGVDPAIYGDVTTAVERAAAELPMEMWGYGTETLDPSSPIHAKCHGEAWGLDMYAILAGAELVLNRHGTIAEGQANNMRLFEATGAGALLLTEAARELDQMFDVGTEVVAYSSADDLIEKARHYLANPDDRVAVARAGQERTLRDHTYRMRMAQFDAMLRARMGGQADSSASQAS
jgi:spore maturation protein CgeB